jgi:peptide/nickel transport system permease protein
MTQAAIELDPLPTGERRCRAFKRLFTAPIDAYIVFLFITILAVASLFPHLLAWGDPYATDPSRAFQSPSWHHVFGTDYAGRDLYTRVIFGARQSLLIGVLSTAIGLTGGLTLGLGSALGPRAVDIIIGRFIEVLFVFPTILMALVFIALLGTGVGPLIVAVGVGSIPDAARLIRAQALKVKQGDFVVASRALGRSESSVLLVTILPNVIRSIFVIATLGVGQAILWASSLSFLGLGAAPPSPEWGVMLADGRDYLQAGWWISLFPGLFITFSVLSLTVAGRYLQRRSEGR